MEDRPLVSVIMPVYRPDPRFFPAAVESVLAQTYPNLELIVVEDPSELKGRDMLRRIDDSRLRYIEHEQRTSLPRQHNRALAETRGAFICRFDADDVCEPDRIERELEFLEKHPDIGVVGSCLRVIDARGETVAFREYPLDPDAILRTLPRSNPIANSSVMFRREIYERFGGWRTDSPLPAQDYEWYSRLARGGVRFANLPDYLVRYRLHEGSIKSTQLRDTLRSTIEVKRMYWRNSGFVPALVLFAERALTVAPSWLVWRLFSWLRYRRARRNTAWPRLES